MNTRFARPETRPACPHFSSGPTAKYPGFSLDRLSSAALGRSHRSSEAKKKLKLAIDRSKKILEIPDDYRVAIVPASDTGAVEMCMWSMLGLKPVDVFAWESFGQDWVTDAIRQLKLPDCNTYVAEFGELPDFSKARDDADIVFTWNGTTSGVRVRDGEWIRPNPERIVICDATSAAFSQEIDWRKLDVITYSWQKCLGGEAAHGMLILSPNAVRRLETFVPDRALPKLFRMTKGGRLDEELFEGATINTPSMLCVEDYLLALDWVEGLGGWRMLKARSDESLTLLTEWEAASEWAEFLCRDPLIRSNTGVTFRIKDPRIAVLGESAQRDFIKAMMKRLEAENACFDAAGYAKAPPGLRIWAGGSVDPENIRDLLPWLDWAFQEEVARL